MNIEIAKLVGLVAHAKQCHRVALMCALVKERGNGTNHIGYSGTVTMNSNYDWYKATSNRSP